MESKLKCPQCGSSKVVPYARIVDRGDISELNIAVSARPNAWVFKQWELVRVLASVCCDCSWVSLSAVGDLGGLWRAYQDSEHPVAIPEGRVQRETSSMSSQGATSEKK